MNRTMNRLFITLFCLTFIAAGCAKKEMVKSEEPVTELPKAVETAPPSKTPSDLKEQVIPETSAVKEESLDEMTIESVPATQLKTVYFDFDSYVLSADARDTLKKNAEWILKNKAVKVQVQGHCDERGSAEYNLALGENRAKSVIKYLQALGIQQERLVVLSFGKEKPVDMGHDEAAWAKNRRADFALIK
ncbi:MAG: OmpA/MotB domain protein [Geobacteraceae bacterium]|nr:OmpA/MotB domain protein [Geobacteraceae bacterium]